MIQSCDICGFIGDFNLFTFLGDMNFCPKCKDIGYNNQIGKQRKVGKNIFNSFDYCEDKDDHIAQKGNKKRGKQSQKKS